MTLPTLLSMMMVATLAACTDTNDSTNDADTSDVDAPDTGAPLELGAWTSEAPLARARIGHSATRLDDDSILIVGGAVSLCPDTPDSVLASVERVAPDGTLTAAAPLAQARRFHAALRLDDGRVLVVGGEAEAALTSVEVYDATHDTWSDAAPLAVARARPTLVAWGAGGAVVASAGDAGLDVALFSPDGTWAAAPPLPPRAYTTSVALKDGRVLFVSRDGSALLAADGLSAALVAPMPELSGELAAARADDGSVLVVAEAPTGDFTEAGPVHATQAFRWDPSNDRWSTLGDVPFGSNAVTLVSAPTGEVFGRAGYGPWFVRGDAWRLLASTASVQQGPLVPLADGSLRLVAGSGNPTCAAVASVLAWYPDLP